MSHNVYSFDLPEQLSGPHPEGMCQGCGRYRTAGKYCSHECYADHLRAKNARSLIARFWGFVNKSDGDGCWLWTGSMTRGYGQFSLPRLNSGGASKVYAHRYSWALTNGNIPDNLSVLHRCDTPACVRPDHLFLGTQGENLMDAERKGRLVRGQALIKVSDAGLADIKANYHPRHNGKQLAEKYGISLVHLCRLVNGTGRVTYPKRLQTTFEVVPRVNLPVRGEVA